MDRRTLLASGAAATAGSSMLLAGCTTEGEPGSGVEPSTDGSTSGGTANAPRLPDYIPFDYPDPDLPPTDDGVMPGYFSFPDPAPYSEDGLLEGTTLSALVQGDSRPQVPLDRNTFWQALNKRLGGEITFELPPTGADYMTKFSTRIAGGDLPDVVNVLHSVTPRLVELLHEKFQDLTEFLAGDAIADYPGLANNPTEAWQSVTFNGSIMGWPKSEASLGSVLMIRDDLKEQAGYSGLPESGAEFLEMCRALTEPRKNQWAAMRPDTLLVYVQQMFGAPNLWRNDGGKFTHRYETEETAAALDFVRGMWDEGLFDPDSYGTKLSPYRTFPTGRIAMMYGAWQQWGATIRDNRPLDPNYSVSAIPPLKFDGGGLAPIYLFAPISKMFCMKKMDDKDRIRQILRVMNWFAGPFGTDVFIFNRFGIEGEHHTVEDGIPVLTDKGKEQVTSLPNGYLASSGGGINYQPIGEVDIITALHEYEKIVRPGAMPYPLAGLFSETQLSEGVELDRRMLDTTNEVIQGRKTMEDWTAAVAEWRERGGDQIRAEYEESYQASGGQ